MCFISKHTFNACINSPSPFNFLYSRFKNIVFFPTREVPIFSREKGGHCVYYGFLSPDPLLSRPGATQAHCLACLMKLPKASHYIKTTQEPTKRCSPRTRLGSRVPLAGHLTAYGKFVMGKYTKWIFIPEFLNPLFGRVILDKEKHILSLQRIVFDKEKHILSHKRIILNKEKQILSHKRIILNKKKIYIIPKIRTEIWEPNPINWEDPP